MTKKVSRVLRSMLLVLMSLIFLAGGDFILPAGNVSAYAAQVKSKSVSKQKQLKKALKGKKNRKNRIITITKGGSYTIPAGTYTNVTINVRKKVRLNVRGKGLRIVLSEGARGSFVILNKKNTVEARCNATVRLERNAGNSKIVANGNGNTVKVINKSSRKKLKIRTASGSRKVKKGNKNAIYLTAPKKQAVVSARSSAAKTAKAAGTVKPASHTAASGNQAGASSGKTPSTPAIEEKALLDAGRTRIVDLGFVKYVAVTFADGRSLDNTKILVDGADVSSVMTKVSDDGSVMKWEVSTLKPAQLVAVDRENDSVKTTVKLSDNAKPEIPEVKASEAPAYVLGYAPVAYWDYYASITFPMGFGVPDHLSPA